MRGKGSLCFHRGVAFRRSVEGDISTSVGVPGTAVYSCGNSEEDRRLRKSCKTLRPIFVPRSSLWRIDSNVYVVLIDVRGEEGGMRRSQAYLFQSEEYSEQGAE